MEIIAGHQTLTRRLREPAVAIGNFDGVHRGHQALLRSARGQARALSGESVVLTFSPHPARLLNPRLAPPLIMPLERRLELLGEAGIDVCIVEPFTPALARLDPGEFVDQVLVTGLGVRSVCIGADFTFGKGRAGNVALLGALGRSPERHFGVEVLAPVTVDGMICSSTKVREFVLEGRVDGAALLLGRDPELQGEIVAGCGRGRTIGIPTANLRVEGELMPAPGVYSGWAEILSGEGRGIRRKAAVNIGTNPTFGAGALGVEAHLLDFAGPALLGARMRLGLCRRLRAEQRFPSVEALVKQINQDIEATRSLATPSGER